MIWIDSFVGASVLASTMCLTRLLLREKRTFSFLLSFNLLVWYLVYETVYRYSLHHHRHHHPTRDNTSSQQQVRWEKGWSFLSVWVATMWQWMVLMRRTSVRTSSWTASRCITGVFSAGLLYLWSELVFYAQHRLLHSSSFFVTQVHSVHHRSVVPTAWAGLSFHPLESFLFFSPSSLFLLSSTARKETPLFLKCALHMSLLLVGCTSHHGCVDEKDPPPHYLHHTQGWNMKDGHDQKGGPSFNFAGSSFVDKLFGTDRPSSSSLVPPVEAVGEGELDSQDVEEGRVPGAVDKEEGGGKEGEGEGVRMGGCGVDVGDEEHVPSNVPLQESALVAEDSIHHHDQGDEPRLPPEVGT